MSNWYVTPNDNDLMHYGIKGMKWRFKRGRKTPNSKKVYASGSGVGSNVGINALAPSPDRLSFMISKHLQLDKNFNYAQAKNVKILNYDPIKNIVKVKYSMVIPSHIEISRTGTARRVPQRTEIGIVKSFKVKNNKLKEV